MFKKTRKYLKNIFHLRLKYLLQFSIVVCDKNAQLSIGKNVKLIRSKIILKNDSLLIIGDNSLIYKTTITTSRQELDKIIIGDSCKIENTNIKIQGTIIMGNYNILDKGSYYKPLSIVCTGNITIGDYNRIRCGIWSRYNSNLSIGNYNNINEESEIRCDDMIIIGDYNQISYNCSIWDTNTHCIYSAEKRRNLTETKYPVFGFEFEKPKTKKITIGNDNWIGKNSSILKGSTIKNKCIIGFATILSNQVIESNRTVVSKNNIIQYENNI